MTKIKKDEKLEDIRYMYYEIMYSLVALLLYVINYYIIMNYTIN